MTWPEGDWRNLYFTPEKLAETLDRVDRADRQTCRRQLSLPEAALRFILACPDVSTVIPGMRRVGHVEANLAASDGRPALAAARRRAPEASVGADVCRDVTSRLSEMTPEVVPAREGRTRLSDVALTGTAILSFAFVAEELTVKPGIHPKYYDVEARCACGNTFKTRSTKPELHLEICNTCHPFFTGRQKLIDTEGRVERFTKRFGAQTAEARKAQATATKAAKATKGKKAAKSASASERRRAR